MGEKRTIAEEVKDQFTIDTLQKRTAELLNELHTANGPTHKKARMKLRFLTLTSAKTCEQVKVGPTETVRVVLDAADKYLQKDGLSKEERNMVHSFKYGLRLFSALQTTGRLDSDGPRLVKVRKTKTTTKAVRRTAPQPTAAVVTPKPKPKEAPGRYPGITRDGTVLSGTSWVAFEWARGVFVALDPRDRSRVDIFAQHKMAGLNSTGAPVIYLPWLTGDTNPTSTITTPVLLSAFLCGTGEEISHLNKDPYDFRRTNLRISGTPIDFSDNNLCTQFAQGLVTATHSVAALDKMITEIRDTTKPVTLEKEKKEWLALVELAETERDATKTQVADLELKLKAAETAVTKAKTALKSARARQDAQGELQNTLRELRSSLNAKRQECVALKEELTEIRETSNKFEKVSSMEDELSEAHTSVANLEVQVERLTKANKELGSRLRKRVGGENGSIQKVAVVPPAVVDAVDVIRDLLNGSLKDEYKLRFIGDTIANLQLPE